jgi:hypothetical protein
MSTAQKPIAAGADDEQTQAGRRPCELGSHVAFEDQSFRHLGSIGYAAIGCTLFIKDERGCRS